MASFDGNGLQIDRLADVREDIENALKEAFGDGINLGEESPFGVITGIMAERYSLLWEILESVYQASFPNTAFGIYLDELSAFNGVIREPATKSAVDLTFQRSTDTGTGDVTIPIGTQVTASGASTVVWTTEVLGTIDSLVETTVVQAFADDFGPIGALAGTLTVLVSTPAEVESVTNLNDAELGDDEETDSELRLRRATQLGQSGTATDSGIRSAVQLLDDVRSTAIVVNDTDNTVGDLPPHSFEVYVAMQTGADLAQKVDIEWDADFVTGNSISLELDGNPIAGSPVPFNATQQITMSDVATALEAELNIGTAFYNGFVGSRVINVGGSTTVDFVLTSTVTGGASQAVDTVTPIASANPINIDLIAQTIWDSKAAGIETYGDLQGTAVDTQGNNHLVRFSPINDIRIFVRFSITNTEEYDPANETAMSQAVVDYAAATYVPGTDVLSYKLLCAASDVNAPGIDEMVCDVTLDEGAFGWSKSLEMDVFELATIDSADITYVLYN